MKRANASRPVPVSPTSSTGESLPAICARSARSCCMTRLRPTGTPGEAANNLPAWRLRLPASSARSTVRSSFCSDSGFSTKSKAPRRVASTAVSTVPWPDIMTTGQEDSAGCALPFAQQRDAVGVGHPDVEQYEIGELPCARGARLAGVAGDVHVITFLGENLLEKAANVGLVIDDQNVCGAHARSFLGSARRSRATSCRDPSVTGKDTRTRPPPSGRLSASTRPPCSSTIFFTIASPSPVPLGLLVT